MAKGKKDFAAYRRYAHRKNMQDRKKVDSQEGQNHPYQPHTDPNSREFQLGLKKKRNPAEVTNARRFQSAIKRKKMAATRPNIAIGEHDPTSPHRTPRKTPIPIPRQPLPNRDYPSHPTTNLNKGELHRQTPTHKLPSKKSYDPEVLRRRLNRSSNAS